jgi:BirA family biotin operon repressor/biotin-[acetyl-CoA-carboxylase] ligase
MILSESSIRSRLRSRVVGSRLVLLESVDSTSDRAWREALAGAPDGACVLAESQSRGRGRHGRSWHAPPGLCVLLSAVLRPALPAARAPLMTAVGALAASDACRDAAGLATSIRFPNDLFAGGRKIAGVLVESRFVGDRPDLFIVGVGLNVNAAASDFPDELRPRATSVLIETGAPRDLNAVAAALLGALDDWYGRLDDVPRVWRERSDLPGRRVRVLESGRALTGVVVDLDVFEGIALRLESGLMRQVRGERVEGLEVEPGDG